MFRTAIPVLHVAGAAAAEAFYCERLGFRREFAYRPHEDQGDPCYLGLVRDQLRLHLSSFSGDGVAGGVVFLLVDDVDDLYRELISRDVRVDLSPTDQTWGNREMYITDPDGNRLRFVRAAQSEERK